MLPIQRKISAYNHYNGNTIKYIVIHDVGTRSTAKNNVDYFSGGNRNASAHYFVDDTSIWQSVEDFNGAWHVGDGNGKYGITNTNSIGIEQCLPDGTVTAKTEQNTVELTQFLMKKYNIPIERVVRHYDASRKNCPAQFNLDGKWTRWVNFKKKLSTINTNTSKTTQGITEPKLGLWYRSHVSDIGWLGFMGTEDTSGTTGQNRALEAVEVLWDGKPNSIRSSYHKLGGGWTEVPKGITGTTGKVQKMDQVCFASNSALLKTGRKIQYRVHSQDVGWSSWKEEGAVAGTKGKKIEAIQMRMIKNGKVEKG